MNRRIEQFCKNYDDPDKYKGLRVFIEDCSVASYEKYHLLGNYGTIVNFRCTTGSPCMLKSIAISVDGKHNTKSEQGLFWLHPRDLILINDEGENNMNNNIYNNYNICRTLKPGTNQAEYQYYKGELTVGDYVICNNNHSNHSLSVRIVREVLMAKDELSGITIDGEVMGVANVKDYFARKEREKQVVELKKKMIERAKKYQEEAFWKMIAESDPEMANLYKEFEELSK